MFLDSDQSSISPGDLTSGVGNDNGYSDSASRSFNESPVSPSAIRQSLASNLANGRLMTSIPAGNSLPAQPSSSGAFEIKFVIDEAKGEAIREWARRHMQPDPHSSPEFGYGYLVNSLYLDTPDFDVYRRGDGFRQRKYRLRRYGSESGVWMELKRKTNGQVRKRRTLVCDSELASRISATPDAGWEGLWFQKRLQSLQLRPVCQVTYQRFACVATSSTGTIRLTIDSDLNSRSAAGWDVPYEPLSSGRLLHGQQILELKFREAAPAAFRGLIEDFRLTLGAFSKYRQSVEACISMDQLMHDSTPGQSPG